MNNNKLNAEEIANLAIKKEIEYSKIDYSKLGCYEKCSYLLECDREYHPTVGCVSTKDSMINNLIPELRKKCENGENNAKLLLSMLLSRTTFGSEEAEYLLKQEIADGNPYAALFYLRCIIKPTNDDRILAEKLLEFFKSYSDEKLMCVVNIICGYVIGILAEGIELESINKLVQDSWKKLALQGYFYAIEKTRYYAMIALKNASVSEVDAFKAEYAMWEKVVVLIVEHFYKAGNLHLGE